MASSGMESRPLLFHRTEGSAEVKQAMSWLSQAPWGPGFQITGTYVSVQDHKQLYTHDKLSYTQFNNVQKISAVSRENLFSRFLTR